MGSIRRPKVEEPSDEEVMKFEMQETMQTFDSFRTLFKHSANRAAFVQGTTWAPSILGRSRQLMEFMFRWTLESPMMEKILSIAAELKNNFFLTFFVLF